MNIRISFTYLFLATVALAVLQLTGAISVSWWVITLPILLPIYGVIAMVALVIVVALVVLAASLFMSQDMRHAVKGYIDDAIMLVKGKIKSLKK